MTALAVIAGPPSAAGWCRRVRRAVFYINVPIAAATLFIILKYAGTSGGDPRRIDWMGTLSVTAALGLLTFGLIENQTSLTIASIVPFIAFIVVERRAANPIVPLSLFRSRTFSAANALTFLLYAAVGAVTFLLPFHLIQALHYSSAKAGPRFFRSSSRCRCSRGGWARRRSRRCAAAAHHVPLVAAGGSFLPCATRGLRRAFSFSASAWRSPSRRSRPLDDVDRRRDPPGAVSGSTRDRAVAGCLLCRPGQSGGGPDQYARRRPHSRQQARRQSL